MTLTIETVTRRVATYERVSSEDQRERETIRTQTDELARSLARDARVELVERYVDDGVSGMIPLTERPAGGRLMRDAAAGRFRELHVYKFDRLGRDAVDLLVVRRRLMELGLRVISVVEAEPDLLSYDVQAVVADHARREFLRRSADGMARAAREGRYTGGIVPFGYRTTGSKHTAHLEPDTAPLAGDLSAADIVRRIYAALALEGRSCRSIATEFNALGIPTHYVRDGRGVRGRATQGRWRAGRIRNLVVNPTHKGVLQYGRRAAHEREVIASTIEPLVSADLWQAAQAALARNRTIAKNTSRVYLLGGVVSCGTCGLAYTASQGRAGEWWYRCGGRHAERGEFEGRCPSRMVAGHTLEPQIWADVERFLRDPGDVLLDLAAEADREGEAAITEAEAVTLARALEALDQQRSRAIDLVVSGVVTKEELSSRLARIESERAELERRLAAVRPAAELLASPTELDLLDDVRARLEVGLTAAQRHEIVRLLVRVRIRTREDGDGTKRASAQIEYRFPRPANGLGVLPTPTGTGSSPPRVPRSEQANGVGTMAPESRSTALSDRSTRPVPARPRMS
jgi:site-specific DNA recombinase